MAWRTEGCPACGLDVPYRTPRARCLECGRWAHRPGGRIGDGECLHRGGKCHRCATGRYNLGPLRRFLLEDLEVGEESLDSGLVVMASILWTGPDEARVREATGLDPEAVAVRAERLRRNGVWTGEGVAVDGIEDSVPIALVLAIMCADGLVEAVRRS